MIETHYDPIEGMIKLGLALILLLIVIALTYLKKLQLSWELSIASFRAIIQLM